MKRLLFGLILCLLVTPCFAANEWMNVDADFMDGDAILFNDIDTDINDYLMEPLARVLYNYRQGAKITYATTATLSVAAGEVVVGNSAGTLLKMRRNTSATTVTWSDIDTPSEEASTTYYVWAVADADATTFTIKISKSASAPTSTTYYRKLGSFYNNSSSNILNDETVTNDNDDYALMFGDWASKSVNVTYQATTDGFVLMVTGRSATNNAGAAYILTDSASTPTTIRAKAHTTSSTTDLGVPLMCPVKKNDYYKAFQSGTQFNTAVYWLPSE